MTLKKLALAISLTFILTIAYQVLASYMTSPEGLNYPNPGHYPGEIGPGTFNSSGYSTPNWSFPGQVAINKNTAPNYALDVAGAIQATGDAILGNLDVSGNADIGNNLDVSGDSNVSGDSVVGGNLDVSGEADVGGSIKIGDSGSLGAGTIRWTGSEFQGYNGTDWYPLGNASMAGVSGGGAGEVNFDVWTGSDQNWVFEDTVECSLKVPEDYTVLYAHKRCWKGINHDYHCNKLTGSESVKCPETNIGDEGPWINISCTALGGSSNFATCSMYALAIKANTTGGGTGGERQQILDEELDNASDYTFSSDTVLTEDLVADNILIESGVTVEIGSKVRYIRCNNLTIKGTLSAVGEGAKGGAGGRPGNDGRDGGNAAGGGGGGSESDATKLEEVEGGDGGAGELADGGDGGKAFLSSNPGRTRGHSAPFSFQVAERQRDFFSNYIPSITPITYGAGGGGGGDGGDGGDGGGAISIFTKNLRLTGTIDVSGEDGVSDTVYYSGGGGGGSAGTIFIVVDGKLSGTGTLRANGGDGGDGGRGGGAGGNGGHILISAKDSSVPYTIEKSGGSGGNGGEANGENGNSGVYNEYLI